MRLFGMILLGSLTVLASCQANAGRVNYILNQKLANSHQQYEETMKADRSAISFSMNQTAQNCSTYLALVESNKLDESVHNQLAKSEYLVCDVLGILSAKRVKYEAYGTLFGKSLAQKLDLRSFPSSLYRVCDENKHTLRALFPDEIKTSDNRLDFETDDWNFTLEVVGVAHVNDNDQPDWIVWVADESKFSNYRSYSTIVIFDPKNKNKYLANPYPYEIGK